VAPTLPFTALPSVEVFACEDRVAQLIWRDLPNGIVGAIVNGREHVLGEGGRPGAGEITGLTPRTSHLVDITLDGRVICQRRIHTDSSVEGAALTRIATISDLHLGEEGFGFFKEMKEAHSVGAEYPLRCARAAVREAEAWGAELLVIKGDITELGLPHHWALFDELLEDVNIPVVAIPGNHDTVGRPNSLDATAELQRRGLFPSPVHTIDIPGVRLIVANTAIARHTWGKLKPIADDLVSAVAADRPSMLFVHHHLETHFYPRIWPLGARRRDASHVLNAMLERNPDLFISSGHTHRNRRRQHGSAMVTEVGSTKDHPGVWAGYVVHEAGVRQVVRRVAEPSCMEWTDRTHAAVGGLWGQWSPGTIGDRSFHHAWSPVSTSPTLPGKRAHQRASLTG
jgi:Icc protein